MMDRIPVDLRAKHTEVKWQEKFDHFSLEFTPIWFDWVQWLLVLGGLKYAETASSSRYLSAIYGVRAVLMLVYFQAFFFRRDFWGFPFTDKREGLRRLLSLVLSGALAGLAITAVN